MTRYLGIFAAALISALASSAPAVATVEFEDDASWRGAAQSAGYSIHPYTGGVTITAYTTTIEFGDPNSSDPLIILGTEVESHHQLGLSEIVGDFTFWEYCGTVPGCEMSAYTRMEVVFDDPIFGIEFASAGQGTPYDDQQLSIEPGDFFILAEDGGSFGLIGGPITELDFVVNGFTDSPNTLRLTNIVVATAPEPASLAIVVAGLPFIMRRARKSR